MSIQPYQLEAEYSSSEEAEEDSEDSEGRSLTVTSSESECVLQRTPIFVKASGRFVTLHFTF